MGATHGTVDYYRDRLATWSDDHALLAAALGSIEVSVNSPDVSDAEARAQVRNVLKALHQVRYSF